MVHIENVLQHYNQVQDVTIFDATNITTSVPPVQFSEIKCCILQRISQKLEVRDIIHEGHLETSHYSGRYFDVKLKFQASNVLVDLGAYGDGVHQ
jgi:hypothetical protein